MPGGRADPAMDPVVTLTMNPAVDVATEVDVLVPEHKLRCANPRFDAGGGGINVARALKRLGSPALAIFASGGANGHRLEKLLRGEDISCRTIPIAGETRESFSVREMSTSRQFRFVLPGPALNSKEIDACVAAVNESAGSSTIVVASGSLPSGVREDFYGTLAETITKRGARFMLDSSGAPLEAALGRGIYLMKPSRRELSTLTGQALNDEAACIAACRSIVQSGRARYVALTLGPDGAVLIGRDLALRARAPATSAVSSVGAGDSFLGALVWSLAAGRCFADGLKLAVAAGSASLLTPGTGLFGTEDLAHFHAKVVVEKIDTTH